MSMLGRVKKIEVKADATKYKYLVYAVPKAGKSSLFYNMFQEKFGGQDKLLFVAFEHGHSALKGANVVNIEEWADFLDLVDEVEENKDNLPFEAMVIDTVDMAQNMCERYSLKKLSRQDGITYKSMSGANAPAFGGAYTEVKDQFINALNRLESAGITLSFICHDKEKVSQTRTGEEFSQIGTSLSGKVRDVINGFVDMIIYIDLIRDFKNIEVNAVAGNSKKKEKKTVLTDEKRIIRFRGDSTVLAGSRFPEIVDYVEYSAENFIEAVEDAINAQYGGDEAAKEKARAKQDKERAIKLKQKEPIAVRFRKFMAANEDKTEIAVQALQDAGVTNIDELSLPQEQALEDILTKLKG